MNYNTTPREDLLKRPECVKRHHELVEDEALRDHISIALNEMQLRAAGKTDPSNFNQCAAAHLRVMGAHDFVEIFMNLCETSTIPTRKDVGNLPGNVSSLPRKN